MAINVLKLYFFQIKFFFCFPVCSSPSGLTQSSLSSAWMMSWVSACYLVTLLKWLNIGNIFLMSPWFWFLLTVSFENRIIAQSELQETQIESWYGFLQREKRYVNDWIKYQARIELANTVAPMGCSCQLQEPSGELASYMKCLVKTAGSAVFCLHSLLKAGKSFEDVSTHFCYHSSIIPQKSFALQNDYKLSWN